MFCKHTRAMVLLLALVALLSLLSGCGSNMIGQTGSAPATPITSGNLPDSVQITLGGPGIAQATPPQLTLHKLAPVQQLYKTMLALPSMPPNMACPADAGPSYQLVFRYGTHTLAQAEANRGGCGTVTISGGKQPRLASQSFWTQLNQAIAAATPVPKPQALAIQHTLQGNQPVLTARIANAAIAQRLYSALLIRANCSLFAPKPATSSRLLPVSSQLSALKKDVDPNGDPSEPDSSDKRDGCKPSYGHLREDITKIWAKSYINNHSQA